MHNADERKQFLKNVFLSVWAVKLFWLGCEAIYRGSTY